MLTVCSTSKYKLLHQTPILKKTNKKNNKKSTSLHTPTKRDLTAHPGTCLSLSTLAPRFCAPAPWFKLYFSPSSSHGNQVSAQGPALGVHAAGKMEKPKASCICNLELNVLASLTSRKPTNPLGKHHFRSDT